METGKCLDIKAIMLSCRQEQTQKLPSVMPESQSSSPCWFTGETQAPSDAEGNQFMIIKLETFSCIPCTGPCLNGLCTTKAAVPGSSARRNKIADKDQASWTNQYSRSLFITWYNHHVSLGLLILRRAQCAASNDCGSVDLEDKFVQKIVVLEVSQPVIRNLCTSVLPLKHFVNVSC